MQKRQRGARFSTTEEFQAGLSAGSAADLRFTGCGIPLISTKDELWVDNSEAHTIGIGSTGSGKSTLGAIPAVYSMLACDESIIVTDLKGEIFRATSGAAKKAGYKVIVVNFDRPTRSNYWNPLTLPYEIYHKDGIENRDEAAMLAYDIAYSICAMPRTRDRFWDISSINFTCGLIQGLIEDAPPEEVNMKSVALIGNLIHKRFASSNYLKEYFELKPADSIAALSASGTIGAPNETRGGIVSVDRQSKRIFIASEGLSRMMMRSDFSYEDIVDQKTIVYLQYPGETNVFMPLVSCFIGQVYCALVRIAKGQANLRLPRRCNFVLDEFSNLTINEFPNRLSMARGYNMRFLLFVQDVSQLQQKYSNEDMLTILSNCTTKVYYNVDNYALKQQLASECGMTQSITEHGTTQYGPLLTPFDLGMLRFGEALVLRRGVNYPYVTRLTPCFEMHLPNYNTPAELPTLPDIPTATFDLCRFVKEKKYAKLFAQLENAEQKERGPAEADQDPEEPVPEDRPSCDPDALVAKITNRIAKIKAKEATQRSNAMQDDPCETAGQKLRYLVDHSAFDDNGEEELIQWLSEEDADLPGFIEDDDTDTEYTDETYADDAYLDEAFARFNTRLRDIPDDPAINCVFGNSDMIDLMKMDGMWDEQQAENAADMDRIAAMSFVGSFEKGEMELSSLFQYVLQLPVYADYLEVRRIVYATIEVNARNQQRLFDHIDSHLDSAAFAALLHRFPLTDAQKDNLRRLAMDLMIDDLE